MSARPSMDKPIEDQAEFRDAEKAGGLETVEVVHVSAEDDRRICRAIDKRILPILVWIYFLQILDKSLLGYAAVWGLQTDAHLHGTQYSFIGSCNAIMQLCWLPFSSYLIVRLPTREYATFLVFGWGCASIGNAFSKSYGTLVASRMLLGLFEAACLPLFSVITTQWYKRSEQPLRVACWYGTNGFGTILGALLSWGVGHSTNTHIKSWQLIFLVGGLLTVVTCPIMWLRLDAGPMTARFLNEEDKLKAFERVRTNRTGTGTHEYKRAQALECLYDLKSWGWVGLAFLLNIGAQVTNTFGPVIIKGLGFDTYNTTLLNMPFGVVQFLVIVVFAYVAYRWKYKGPVLAAINLPVLVGAAMLYGLGRSKSDNGPLLVAYYLLGFLYAGNPLIISWAIANTGGSTKKATTIVMYNIGSSAGNVVGPLLFNSKDAPYYKPGLKAVLGIFAAMMFLTLVQMFGLHMANKYKEKKRVELGMEAKVVDLSMTRRGEDIEEVNALAIHEDTDITDYENKKFVYLL